MAEEEGAPRRAAVAGQLAATPSAAALPPVGLLYFCFSPASLCRFGLQAVLFGDSSAKHPPGSVQQPPLFHYRPTTDVESFRAEVSLYTAVDGCRATTARSMATPSVSTGLFARDRENAGEHLGWSWYLRRFAAGSHLRPHLSPSTDGTPPT